MSSQTSSRIHVSNGSVSISPRHETIPRIGTSGTSGVRNGRSSSGRLRRSTHTPPHTSTNASSVPMFTSWPRIWIGNSPVKTATAIPV